MRGLMCPACNADSHIPFFEKDGLYVCALCKKVLGYYCKGCDRIYTENRLALHQDAYVCKECGTIQWGYTEWKRK